MEESIVFSPNIPDRSIDKQAQKVDDRLEETGTITPDLDTSGLGDVELDGVGGVGGGGMGGMGGGGAAAGGAAALASKIPKPIAGVSVAAALPVALGGAVGAGMLSAMHSSSAQLQTSTKMLGQAWTMFWRPFGNRLDELFVRDLAQGILSTMVEFNEIAQNEGLAVGLTWLAGEAESAFANAVGGAMEGALETFGIDMDIGGEVSGFLKDVDWFKVLTSGPAGTAAAFGSAAARAVSDWIGSSFPNVTSDEVMAAITLNPVAAGMIADKLDFDLVQAGQLLGAIAFAPVAAPAILGAMTFEAVTGNSLVNEFQFNPVGPNQLLGQLQFDPIASGQLVGAMGFPSIGAGMILTDVFGGISMTAQDVLDYLFGGGQEEEEEPTGNGGGGGGGGSQPQHDTRQQGGGVGTGGGTVDTNPAGVGVGGAGTPGELDAPHTGGLDTDPSSPGVGGAGTSDDDSFSGIGGYGGGGGGGFQRGGVVSSPTRARIAEAGPEVVQPLSEFERMIERVASRTGGGGEVDMTTVERKLDRLHRDLQALSEAMGSMTIEVDGETLGRATTNARHRKVFDSDSLL